MLATSANRKTSYKLPPTTITDKLISQDARRKKALEDQKRRRAQKFDSGRQLDLFADLNLGPSDDDDDETIEERGASVGKTSGVAPFVPALQSANTNPVFESSPAKQVHEPFAVSRPMQGTNITPKKRSKKRRRNKPSKWADRCMYAELLEMLPDGVWENSGHEANDGLPNDLETGWVAVAPVPVGKRCLAITHQSSGTVGNSPNTTLKSRLLGKTLIAKFPSNLPALTILDCILDTNWKENGILHVLDVIKWKGQDVADCETAFRFWWRDTRLAELTPSAAASAILPSSTTFSISLPHQTPTYPNSTSTNNLFAPSSQHAGSLRQFNYPTTFLPVPYHTNTSLETLHNLIIPAARSIRYIDVQVPVLSSIAPPSSQDGIMEIDVLHAELQTQVTTHNTHTLSAVASVQATIQPDGMLLYVAEASYEMGTSPLSSWIPISAEVGRWEKNGASGLPTLAVEMGSSSSEHPLDLFQRLVKRGLEKRATRQADYAQPHMDTEMHL